jgi:hypothetical protein
VVVPPLRENKKSGIRMLFKRIAALFKEMVRHITGNKKEQSENKTQILTQYSKIERQNTKVYTPMRDEFSHHHRNGSRKAGLPGHSHAQVDRVNAQQRSVRRKK